MTHRYARLFEDHFGTLGSKDVLDFGDAYSRLLRPDLATGTALDHILKAFVDVVVASGYGQWRHVNYFTFRQLVDQVARHVATPVILETGSSAYGTNSSLLFAALAEAGGGSFDTVDLNPATTARVAAALRERHGDSARLRCHNGDSVGFIAGFDKRPNVVYLDSYDLLPDRFGESAEHGLKEFEALLPKLPDQRSFILIDDTPCSREIFRKMCPPEFLPAVDAHVAANGRLPGKGERIIEAIRDDRRFSVLAWEYQVLLSFTP